MKGTRFAMLSSAAALGSILMATGTLAQTPVPTSGPAENGSPAWSIKGSFPDPGGRTAVDRNGVVTVLQGGPGVSLAPPGLVSVSPPMERVPGCRASPLCTNRRGIARGAMQRVFWEPNPAYEYQYPYHLPEGIGGVPAVALDSRNNLWVLQRKPAGMPQLFKFDPNYNLILEVPETVLPYHSKAHGMAVDADDNVWVLDTGGATATKLSPDGRVLMTIGERGRRGDWNEAEGQRLLWEPVMIAFGPRGDIYIAMGHGHESPNDADSDQPHNNIGASRILHLDRDGNYKNQWFGNGHGEGKFYSAHGFAIDPSNGDVWIGDREDYRIVIYNSAGQFLRQIATRNLANALQFDQNGDPWLSSGQDGQYLKLDRTGKVIDAIGNGMGIGHGQFIESSYWSFDRDGNLYAGDTSVGRVTKIVRR
jgi:hypothetical protein